MLKIRS